ncbi:hypothetical protein MHBO_001607 [Bonamia ostreae]|uniref:Uncharacterized protein n=1 Tax=Bonamia ostreae TaxID=126728 RepID=A0ABV2AJI8_9EUKA
MVRTFKIPDIMRRRTPDGKIYIRANFSGARLARFRKTILRKGLIWPFEKPLPQLLRKDLPSLNIEKRKERFLKRQAQIAAAMEEMPEKVKIYNEHRNEFSKPRRLGFIRWLTKEFPDSKKKRSKP